MKKFAIAATALALVASSLSIVPAQAATVPAAKALVGADCAKKGQQAANRGADGSDLVCRVATIGSLKGKLTWNYAKDPILKNLDILITADPGGGFDTFGRTVGKSLRAEGLIAGEPTFRNISGGSQTKGLGSFITNDARSAGKALVVGWATIGGVHTTKSTIRTSENVAAARLQGEYQVVVVKKGSKYTSLKALAADIKKDPKSIAFAGGSLGTIDHLTIASIYKALGVDVANMNYNPQSGGGKTAAAILSDAKYSAAIAGYDEFASHIAAGTLVPLAVSAPSKVASISAPTMIEQGVKVTSVNWRGIVLPKGTSDEGRALVIRALDVLRASKSWSDAMVSNKWIESYQYGDAFSNFIKSEEVRIPALFTSVGL